MATWTYSQPGAVPFMRWFDCRVLSPVMRWPTRLKRPSFLISIWMISPGVSRSYRGRGLFGSRADSRLRPRRLQIRLTVAFDRPSASAMWSCVQRSRRKASTASQVADDVWLGDERGLDERSTSPLIPNSRKRSVHFFTCKTRDLI